MDQEERSSLYLHRLSDEELRTACKNAIESLELWLRRVIDIVLSDEFGNDYINARNPKNGQYLFRKALRDRIAGRMCSDPTRYPRSIDAALLADAEYIVCHRELYKSLFIPFFEYSYPLGDKELRFFLRTIVESRNNLAHANPISVRQAEQVICYSHDIIDAIKHHMEVLNIGRDFNAPTIIKMSDSNGSVFHDAHIGRNSTGRGIVNLSRNSSTWLRVGDTLSVEAEIDPSFSPDEYRIEWVYKKQIPEYMSPSKRITIIIREVHVGYEFAVYCKVISNKAWHRCGDVDDCVGIIYKVLPRN